ncbi:MAG: hypothetical protein HQM06_13575 [Magnetococcales bacterium]|nr:hypothetical protein [Magnetococcales bacterium]
MEEEVSVYEQVDHLQHYVGQTHDVLTQHEQRIQQLENDVHELLETIHKLLDGQKEEKDSMKRKLAEFEGLQGKVKEVVHTATESGRMVNTLEKRMDNVKKDAFSSVVISVIAFSFLVILSLFLR